MSLFICFSFYTDLGCCERRVRGCSAPIRLSPTGLQGAAFLCPPFLFEGERSGSFHVRPAPPREEEEEEEKHL